MDREKKTNHYYRIDTFILLDGTLTSCHHIDQNNEKNEKEEEEDGVNSTSI